MTAHQPFEDPKIAARYEDWYYTTGQKAANQEKELVKALLCQYDRVHTILEVGCGTGYFTNWMRGMDYETVAFDRSRVMLQEAHQHNHLDCVQGDALALPFLDQFFDLVVMITTLEFIDDPDQALSEAVRVAREGMILGVINRNSLLGCRYRRKGGPIWGAARLFTPNELLQMVSGFARSREDITCKTTLWPIFSGSSKLPWGGFIGLSVSFS